METHYYSCSQRLPPVCYHCGTVEQLLDDYNEFIATLYTQYQVVRPLCQSCHTAGKPPKTWGKKFFDNKKKK